MVGIIINSYECKGNLRFAMDLMPKNTSALDLLSNCAALGSKSVRLRVWDIFVICNSSNNSKESSGRVSFDNGSQTTLVRDRFAESWG